MSKPETRCSRLVTLLKEHTNILLVVPKFIPANKIKRDHRHLPIALLKIASLCKSFGKNFKLIFYEEDLEIEGVWDLILITSVFVFESKYVIDCCNALKQQFPESYVVVGGGYPSLNYEHCKDNTNADEIICGIVPEAEVVKPLYSLVDVDYQIIHTTRGCIRECSFCGVPKIEPTFSYKKSIKNEIIKPKLIFYDNNLLANPYIKHILNEIIFLKKQKKIKYCESQSGIDARLLLEKPYLAKLLHKAGFKNIRLAWDWHYSDNEKIKQQLHILNNAGYPNNNIQIFMIYNYIIPYSEMEQKRAWCFKNGLQVSDSRYIPIDSPKDGYNPYLKQQSNEDYFIHEKWTDTQIRQFRRNCRRHNLCLRFRLNYWHKDIEHKRIPKDKYWEYQTLPYKEINKILPGVFDPSEVLVIQ